VTGEGQVGREALDGRQGAERAVRERGREGGKSRPHGNL